MTKCKSSTELLTISATKTLDDGKAWVYDTLLEEERGADPWKARGGMRIRSDLLIVLLGLCGLALLYSLQFLSGYLASIMLWFWGGILYYCLCPALLVVLYISSRKHEVRPLAFGVLLMVSVCAPFVPLYPAFTRGFLTRMKAEIDPHQLQTWALDLIKTRRVEINLITKSDVEHIEPKRDEPPEYVRRIRGYGSPYVSVGTRHEQWEVSLLYGGGFKGWGLIVSDTSLHLPSDDTLYVVQWEPGIFAVHTR
jgi:hypothetical protein